MPLAGTCPTPMHAPQVAASTLTPAAMSSVSRPSRASASRSMRLLGWTKKVTSGWTLRPFTICATALRSVYEPLVHDPTITWSTFTPSAWETGTTLSGLLGSATSGSMAPRSSSIDSS